MLAYGFHVTRVDFEESRSEKRLASLTRILRALAHPKLVDYDYKETDVEIPFYLGCPEGGVDLPDVDRFGPYILPSAGCAEPGEMITIEGYNFQTNSSGSINFIGFSAEAPDGVSIFRWETSRRTPRAALPSEIGIPNRQVKEDPQAIRATGRVKVGAPMISRESHRYLGEDR